MTEVGYINITDILLEAGQDFTLSSSDDLETVTDNLAIVYGAIRRILVRRGSWDQNLNFGSELYTLLKTKTPSQVSNDELYDIVNDALVPMLQENRVSSVDEVGIMKTDKTSLTMRIILTINGEQFSATINSGT